MGFLKKNSKKCFKKKELSGKNVKAIMVKREKNHHQALAHARLDLRLT